MTPDQCRYMAAAYPTLDGDDTCGDHRHEPRVFALAKALAVVFQGEPITDEKVAWFINDADAIIDDFDPQPESWLIESHGFPEDMYGVDHLLTINGVEYVLPASEWEPSVPEKRETWEADR